MTRIGDVLARLNADLSAEGLRFAVVGGLAVSAWVEPRFTRDVDVAVSVAGDAEAEAVVRALEARGYRMLFLAEQEQAGRLAQVRLCPPGEDPAGVVTDLLFASSGVEPEIAAAAAHVELLPGVTAPVARLHHLVALKVLARDDVRRPQDIADLRALLAEATEADVQGARAALQTITERGFHRGRELTPELDSLVAARTS